MQCCGDHFYLSAYMFTSFLRKIVSAQPFVIKVYSLVFRMYLEFFFLDLLLSRHSFQLSCGLGSEQLLQEQEDSRCLW